MGIPVLVKEIEVETVGNLRRALTTTPDCMEVTDAVGELLCLRFYQDYDDPDKKWLEVA